MFLDLYNFKGKAASIPFMSQHKSEVVSLRLDANLKQKLHVFLILQSFHLKQYIRILQTLTFEISG